MGITDHVECVETAGITEEVYFIESGHNRPGVVCIETAGITEEVYCI